MEFEKIGLFLLITVVLVVPIALLYTTSINFFIDKNSFLSYLGPAIIAVILSVLVAFSGLIGIMFKMGTLGNPTAGLKIMYILFHASAALLSVLVARNINT